MVRGKRRVAAAAAAAVAAAAGTDSEQLVSDFLRTNELQALTPAQLPQAPCCLQMGKQATAKGVKR
jgi:hypothetical protein